MQTAEFIAKFEELTKKMIAIMKAKNNDYAGKDDPLKNLRRHGPYGIVVRMDDKICRLDSFLNPALQMKIQVLDEKLEDTALDLANYALLLVIACLEQKK